MKHWALTNGVIWGLVLWLFGYLFGIVLFMIVPHAYIGWIIMPFGILVTIFVLSKKITLESSIQSLYLAILWTTIAMAADYFFIVKILTPSDGYYKADVYLYYACTFLLPLLYYTYKHGFQRRRRLKIL